MRRPSIDSALLFAGTILVFARTLFNGFAHKDDDIYILGNPNVMGGISWDRVVWAFTTGYAANWHPLTWISLQANASLFGSQAWSYHLVDVLLHAGTAVALYLALREMTGRINRSLLVATIFAIHPYRVESVAWAAERKDVLSGFFAMLALLAYARYARNRSATAYAACLLAFTASLLSKAMVVTLPFLLLLLDVWPLMRSPWSASLKQGPGEMNESHASRPPTSIYWLVLEKLPMVCIALAVSCVTFLVQRSGGMVRDVADYSLAQRVENALVSYVRYPAGLFYPAGLAPYYPHPGDWPVEYWAESAGLLCVCLLFAARQWRTQPWLGVGLLWYLGTFLPMIGLIQVATLAMADRYSYFPTIGLILALAWSIPTRFFKSLPIRALGVGIVTSLGAATIIQVGYWHDADTLWNHAAQVTPANSVLLTNLGTIAEKAGHHDQAMDLFEHAVRLSPRSAPANYDLGVFYLHHHTAGSRLRPHDDGSSRAEPYLLAAARADPLFAEVRHNLGIFYAQRRQPAEAEKWFKEAIRLRPDFATTHAQLGILYLGLKRLEEARSELEQATSLDPRSHSAWLALADAHRQLGQPARTDQILEMLATSPEADASDRTRYFKWLTQTGQSDKTQTWALTHPDAQLGGAPAQMQPGARR